MNCFYRANISTSATIGASFCVYLVDVTFSNCFNRTFIDASPASGAVVINNIGHNQ